MDLPPDLTVIHRLLIEGARRDLHRVRARRVAGVLAATTLTLGAATATLAATGVVTIGWLRVSSSPELPATLKGLPAATVLAADPNALTCDGGSWVAATAVMQSPREPASIPGCRVPSDGERAAYRDDMVATDPSLARPLPYWYHVQTESLATTEGRTGAAAAISPVYVGSPTPLTPDQLRDPSNWRFLVSGINSLRVPTTPLKTVAPKVTAPPKNGDPVGRICVSRAVRIASGKMQVIETCKD